MSNAKSLLKFYTPLNRFIDGANDIIPVRLKGLLESRIEELKGIQKEGEIASEFKVNAIIPMVFKKFKEYELDKNIEFSRSEYRTLTYSLTYSDGEEQSIFNNIDSLKEALSLLNKKRVWKDSFILGLLHCLLGAWDHRNIKSKEILHEFISKKLSEYIGNRKIINSFKKNLSFFDLRNGDVILGDTLSRMNIPISAVAEFIGVNETWVAYPYFSRVISAYFERQKGRPNIEEIIELFKLHALISTKKRLISKLIIKVDRENYLEIQEEVKRIAFKEIGDPDNSAIWGFFEGASKEEKDDLVLAKEILEDWLAKQFIDVFFKHCLNDPRRKDFWLRVASKNRISFKVFGPNHIKARLRNVKKIGEYLDNRFVTVSSNRDVSAFVLFIGSYILIEFSDEGYAFYAYLKDGFYVPDLKKKYKSVDELRNSHLQLLLYRKGTVIEGVNNEGRLSHSDGTMNWEEVFKYWFNEIADINV